MPQQPIIIGATFEHHPFSGLITFLHMTHEKCFYLERMPVKFKQILNFTAGVEYSILCSFYGIPVHDNKSYWIVFWENILLFKNKRPNAKFC